MVLCGIWLLKIVTKFDRIIKMVKGLVLSNYNWVILMLISFTVKELALSKTDKCVFSYGEIYLLYSTI